MLKGTDITHERLKRDFSILLIDDDPEIVKTITRILRAANNSYYIESVASVENAINLVNKTYWDTILLDLALPYKEGGRVDPENGIRALKILKSELKVNAPIIAITGFQDDADLSEKVLDLGAYYFLNKPVRAKSLAAIVRNAMTFQMTGFDGLTGLLNKITFEERLKSEFERIKRRNLEIQDINNGCTPGLTSSCISLIFLDGDNFKTINDTYSHLVGDQVLKHISSSFIDENLYDVLNEGEEAVKYIIRPYDIAARFGGDEFSIFLPETNHLNALAVGRRIRDLIKKFSIEDIVGEDDVIEDVTDFSLSMGIATYPEPNAAHDYEELIHFADNAMYASKETRIGSIFGYSPEGILIKLD